MAATESPRFSVASRVGTACGSVFSAPGVRAYIENRLRGAGITVSSVYTAQLAGEVDCVARGPRAGARGIAVKQCLGYSEVVSATSNIIRPSFANTWRECQSFVCASARCESSMRSGTNTLMNAFFSDLARARPPVTPQALTVKTTSQRSSGGVQVYTAYYAIYILACMVVMLYWQLRSSVTSEPHG